MINQQCCNPFNLENHKNIKTKSRAVSIALAEKAKQYVRIEEGLLIITCDIFNQRICGKCSVNLYKLNNVVVIKTPAAEPMPPITSAYTSSSPSTSASVQSDPISVPPTEVIEELYDEFSEFCIRLGGSPVKKYRFVESGYCQKQIEKVVKLTCENVLRLPVPKISPIDEADDEDDQELLHNILEAYNRQKTSYANQVFLLTLLPEHWPVSKIMDKFKATQYMVQMSKNLVTEYGHGSFPESRKTKPGISSERIKIIEEFYRSMDISRHLPGANDFVSVRDPNGGRIKKQTLFPIVAYYKSATGSTSIISYAVISEEQTHDTVAVYGFQTKFLAFIKSNGAEYPTPKKIYYFSDGAVSQFKNKKNFANINFHKIDFKVDCEWNFFTPSHGKGPSDGVGGTIKRTARAASLRNVDGSLFNTPEEFFQWCKFKSTIKSVHFDYVSKSEYAATKKLLNNRFCNINTVKNTRQIYQVTPNSDVNFINTKMFSNSLITNKTPL